MLKRHILLMMALSMVTAMGQSQITLETTYNYSASTGYIDGEGYKFYEMDSDNNQCLIYNLDHSLYETIALEVPDGQYLYDLKYVTNHLFDQDDGIEVCYTYYEYNDEGQYSTYTTRVINADGSEMLHVPGGGYATFLTTTEEGNFRFVVYVYDYSVIPATVQTKVYSVAGQTTGFADLPALNSSKAFPNPAKDNLTIEYQLPKGINRAQLKVVNLGGQVMLTKAIDSDRKHIRLNTSMLSAGSYIYRIEHEGRIFVKDKFIINH